MDRGFGVTGSLDAAIVRELAPVLDELGYRTLWINDTPDGDSLAGCAAAAAVTDRLRVATGVIAVDRRGPADIARDARDRGIPADRLTIGIGSGTAAKPLARVRAAVADLRRLVEPGTGVAVGALGPKMTRLAATDADEVLLNWLTPAAASISAGEIRSARPAGAGRPARVTAYVRVAMEPAAIARLATEAERYGSYPSYAAHFRRFGVSAVETTIGAEDVATVHERLDAYAGSVDEIVVRAITGEETLDAYIALARACAPVSAG